ncbi:MAG: hypothetical protein IJH65_06550 [Methanobrevibacter sp.]|nr:hypothetical protein [Methanobrevibacter sp.]
MNFAFSFVGLLFLVMLFVPNILWSKCPPKDYEKYSNNENKILLALERIGEVLVTVFSLFCGVSFSFNVVLAIAFLSMIVYELYWIRYFKSPKTMNDMYGNFLFIPLPGATLPVLAFLILGVCANNILLIISAVILGIGHIGIHFGHKQEII